MTDFSALLNPEQCEAATAGDGPILVLAAAGTGKTRTLVHRVAYLVERGIPSERILLLTFTNRAAREMLERAQKVVGPNVSGIWSGTFHHIAAKLLRRWGSLIGYQPGFQIIDEEDQKKLIGDIIKESVAEPKEFVKKELVAKMISEAANEEKPVGFIASRYMTKVAGVDPEAVAMIAKKYEAKKFELGAMDFDDLLVNVLKLLETKENVRELLQEHFLHILVDEYQDTNGIQAKFVDILAAKHRNVMAVGDDFQCIYTWRGAQIENIMEFPKRWQNCKVIKLERNYRSVPGVLNVANVVMKDAPNQFEKTLRPVRQSSGALPVVYRVYDANTQADEIVKLISSCRNAGCDYRDIAVLYRSHYQSITVQLTLARMGVPFRITSGVGVFEQIHVKDVLSYLRLLVNPNDELSFLRLVRLLPSVGEKTANSYWAKLGRKFDAKNANDRLALEALLKPKSKVGWQRISKCYESAVDHLLEGNVGEIIEDFTDLFYENHLRTEWEESEAEDRLADVKELAVQIEDNEGGLEAFLADVALLTNFDAKRNDTNISKVTLSTVHQAKGMEWPVVIVPWLSEGMFPSSKAAEENREDEERRLFYVVVTRAKDSLYMFAPSVRKSGDGGQFPVEASRFLREIPRDLINVKRIMDSPVPKPRYGGYSSGYGSRGSYGSPYGSGTSGWTSRNQTWRR